MVRQAYAKDHTKKWSDERYTEWLTRHYLAVKMMMSATILLTSHRYAERKNLKIVEPYLLYYACVCCCKALIYTLPDKEWQRDSLTKMSHQKVISISVDALARLSAQLSSTCRKLLPQLKAYRELFSYRFPALGFKAVRGYVVDSTLIVKVCAIFCEVAQLNSECFEASIRKNVRGNYQPSGDVIRASFAYPFLNDEIEDDDDYYRIGYFLRKSKQPSNLLDMATEGMMEDYFGSWTVAASDADSYDPETNMQIIFPFV